MNRINGVAMRRRLSRKWKKHYTVQYHVPLLETLRSTTEKVSPQNITLHSRMSFAIVLSRSRPTMWAKYPKNELV